MKQQKQLKLMCYKVEIVMSTEAWYFLHGTTNGVCNLTYFLSLLSGMSVTEVSKTKRGLGYALHYRYGVRKVMDDGRTAHGKSNLPTNGQGIRGSTYLPF